MNIRKKIKMKRKGFTLMEILVVVSIMAIISAMIILPNINAVKSIRATVDNENKRVLEMAFQQYFLDNDKFPDKTEADKYIDSESEEPFLSIKNGKYLDEIPKVQAKKTSGAYRWHLKTVDSTEGRIEIDLQ